jgi:hypothetical protein
VSSLLDLSPRGYHAHASALTEIRTDWFASSPQSVYMPGTSYVLVPYRSAFDFGTVDYTVEIAFNIAANGNLDSGSRAATLMSTWPASTGWGLGLNGSSTVTGTGLYFETKVAGSGQVVSTVTAVSHNTTHHAAFSKVGSTGYVALDGVVVGSGTMNQNVSAGNDNLYIGRNNPPGAGSFAWPMIGWWDNARITLGVGRFTSDFTPDYDPPASSADPHWDNVILLLKGGLTAPVEKAKQHARVNDGWGGAFPPQTKQPRRMAAVSGFYGDATIAGTVKRRATPTNLPLMRKVWLYHEPTARLIAETWSHPATGVFTFSNLLAGQVYTVLSDDYQAVYRAVGSGRFSS